NMNFRSSYLHMLTDMYTSVAVMIGGLLMKFFQLYWVDSLLTFIIGGYLIYMGLELLKSSVKVLMLFSPEDIPMEEMVDRVTEIEGIKNLHHVHIWQLNEYEVHMEAHVEFHDNIKLTEFNTILSVVEKLLKKDFGINHITLQPEYQ